MISLQGTITYLGEKGNHRLKPAGWVRGYVIVPSLTQAWSSRELHGKIEHQSHSEWVSELAIFLT